MKIVSIEDQQKSENLLPNSNFAIESITSLFSYVSICLNIIIFHWSYNGIKLLLKLLVMNPILLNPVTRYIGEKTYVNMVITKINQIWINLQTQIRLGFTNFLKIPGFEKINQKNKVYWEATYTLSRREIRSLGTKYMLISISSMTVLILVSVISSMVTIGWDFLQNFELMKEVLTTNNWNTKDEWNDPEGHYGALAFIYGSFFVGITALVFCIFLGVTIAIFLSEFIPPSLTRKIQPIMELIAGIPSIIYAVIAYVYVSDYLEQIFDVPNGNGPLNAAITLAFMASPIIVSISIDAMQSTPIDQRNSAIAFGATRIEVFRNVVYPHAKKSIFAGILLAFGRVVGETMVVLIVLGSSPVITWDYFSNAYTLTAGIALEIGDSREGSPEFEVIFILAVILLAMSFVIVLISNLILEESKWVIIPARIIKSPFVVLAFMVNLGLDKIRGSVEVTDAKLQQRIRFRTILDRVIQIVLGTVLVLFVYFVLFFVFKLVNVGYIGLTPRFFFTSPRFSSMIKGNYGILMATIGSLLLILIAAMIAFPIATFTGVYLAEFTSSSSKFQKYVRMSIVNISAIPSVVVGLFVYGVFSVGFDLGKGLLTGSIALAIMMIPIITTNTIEALENIPIEHKNSALALGSSQWEAVKEHKLPYAMPSVVTGYMLGLARIMGETAPLLLVAVGNRYASVPWPTQLVHEGVRALTFDIYYNVLYQPPIYERALIWALSTAIALLIFIIILNFLGYLARRYLRRKYEFHGRI